MLEWLRRQIFYLVDFNHSDFIFLIILGDSFGTAVGCVEKLFLGLGGTSHLEMGLRGLILSKACKVKHVLISALFLVILPLLSDWAAVV